jgi:hypothetical protein
MEVREVKGRLFAVRNNEFIEELTNKIATGEMQVLILTPIGVGRIV